MAVLMFYDAFIAYGPYDLSADHNEIRLDDKADMKEITTFGDTEHQFLAGLPQYDVNGRGYVQFDDSTVPKAVDFNLYSEINVSAPARVLTLCPTRTDGEIAFLQTCQAEKYSFDLTTPNVGMFDFSTKTAGKLARGRLVLPLASRVASNNGTIYQLGALSATQKMISALHVTAFLGTNVVVRLKSNSTAVTGGATTRATFTTVTAPTSEMVTVTGPITDTFWFLDWTLTGTSFSAAGSAGIPIR